MVVWHASFVIAYKDNTNKAVEVVQDRFGVHRIAGTAGDWSNAKKLPKFVEFLATLGISENAVLPENVASYVFRFSATTTNGAVNVLGSNDVITNQVVTNNLSTVTSELTSDQGFRSYFIGNPEMTLLFINDSYIDYDENNSSSEGWTLLKGLESFGVDHMTFTAFDAASLQDTLAQGNKLLIPENEEDTVPWSSEAKQVIADWVAAGNTLMVFFFTEWIDVFNSIFGFSIAAGEGGDPYNKTEAAASTIFAGGVSSLPSYSATDNVLISSLPEGSIAIYSNGSTSILTIVPYGSGKIIIFGWDWYDAAPFGGEGAGDWVPLLNSAVQPS